MQQADSYFDKTAALRVEMAKKIAQSPNASGDGLTSIPWLRLFRRTATTLPSSHIYEPSLGLILQGRKKVAVGEDRIVFDESHFLLTSIDVPVVSYIAEASEAQPFVAMTAKLDLAQIRQWILEYDIDAPKAVTVGRGMGTGVATLDLFTAFARLLDLLDNPGDIPVMSDVILRELVYRLLSSEQGGRLWHVAMSGSRSHGIHKIITWLTRNYAEPLRVDDLADMAAMSVSSMHHHFRELTSMSPLQFQKQHRLHEARRLMLVDSVDAGMAASKVGYESASHFNREYARMFGHPPLRDIKRLRASALALQADPEAART